jgi:2-polyprenyl-6-hydroxyphenyl methylase/3-demethylubiquinone-9 3-methyltransferase
MLRHAPSNIKRLFWDREFSSGKWNFIDDTAGDCVYPYLEKYVASGSILDLGCGPGNTANEVATTTYRVYVGVDISEVALKKARKRTQQNGRADKNQFVCADILTYVPNRQFEVILLRDSIYHVSVGQVKAMFDRYSQYLTDVGVFIVKLIIQDRYTPRMTVRVIETAFDVVEKGQYGRDGLTVLVFRPRRSKAQR